MFDTPGSPMRKHLIATPLLVLLLNLTACDQIQQKMGIVDPAIKEAQTEEEGKAVGGGCRHSGRAIEDCYAIYNWLPKAAVFAGWREMDAYVRENKIDTIEPLLPPPESPEPPAARKSTKNSNTSADSKPSRATKDH